MTFTAPAPAGAEGGYMAVDHTQAPITISDEIVFHVDENLQSMIQFLVDRGVCTYNSCQDSSGGTCWIEYDLLDWMEIVNAAFRSSARDLYQFIEEECEVKLHAFDDGHPDENDDYWIEGEDLLWSASVRFPKDMLGRFEKLMQTTLTKFTIHLDE
jgi:hypothetical protein